MPVDTFICGECQLAFHDITQFVQHKNETCPTGAKPGEGEEAEEGGQTVIINLEESMADGGEEGHVAEGTMLMEVAVEEGQSVTEAVTQAVQGQLMNAIHGQVEPQPGIELVPVSPSVDQSHTGAVDLQIIVKSSDNTTPHAPARRRGRPRKGEEKNPKPKKPPPPPKQDPERLPPETKDGKLYCSRCRKTFGKERHFKTHKCLYGSDYVDFSKRDAASGLPDDLGGDSEEDETQDDSYDGEEFKVVLPKKPGRGRGRPSIYPKPAVAPKPVNKPDGILLVEASEDENYKYISQILDDESTPGASSKQPVGFITLDTTPESSAKGSAPESQANLARAEGATSTEGGTEQTMPDDDDIEPSLAVGGKIPNKPVFSDPEEKAKFDASLNIDLSYVDHMFKTHVINQDVNENAPPPSSRTKDRLSVFSCNTCEKVFMSLSHVRLHCLIHTDIKPFQCPKCDYTTNTKGNLYTHMRRHTGQLYKCAHCSFKSVNKGHLIEHQAIHNRTREVCKLCRRDYNTPKSLLNHVRKYHGHTVKGKEYLNSFQGKHNRGPAVLHQCHVCNRKFKKKNDRDRHLLVHNITMSEQLYQCGVCEYISARRAYLEKHISRHRIIYACAVCEMKFPSTVRLNQHLSEAHLNGDVGVTDAWQTLFNECLETSLFLPERDGSMDDWMQNPEPEMPVDTTGPDAPDTGEEANAEPTTSQDDTVEEGELPAMTGEEGGDAEDAVENEGQEEMDIMDWAKKLGYKRMGLAVFNRLQTAFGSEECEFCGRLFNARAECELHTRTHTGEKPFPCEQCPFRSASKENLRRHVEREHDKVEYMCNLCSFVATSRSQLWTHTQKHKPAVTIKCSKCDASFEGYKKMKVHLQIKHSELSQSEMKAELAAFHRAGSRIGRKTWKCPYCDRQFTRASSDLQKHIWIHEGIKPFVCPEEGCGHACRSKSNLAVHMLKHSAHKPFNCKHCGKAYKSRTALRWHVRSHEDGKIFKCDKCPYEATQKSHLKRHMETHDILKRFVCAHCNYSANTIGYMKIHYTRNHKGETYNFNTSAPGLGGAKPNAADSRVYRCLSCDYLFGNLSDMKRHLKVRHHVQVEDMRNLEHLDSTHVTPAEGATQHVPPSEVQVVHVQEAGGAMEGVVCSTEEQDATTALQALQYSAGGAVDIQVDEKTVSAVNLLQQIMDISGQSQQITIQGSEDHGGLVAVNPETIIVQQHGEEVVVSSNTEQDGAQQYVIQYVTTEDAMEGVEEAMAEISPHELEIAPPGGIQTEVVSQEQVVEQVVGQVVGTEELSGMTQMEMVKTEAGAVVAVDTSNMIVMQTADSGDQ